MQHRIPDSAISFYMDCMALAWGVDPVIRRKVLSPVVLHLMKVVTSYSGSNLLACALVSTYVQNFDNVQGRSTMPIVVFTTRADHAAQVLSILRNVAKDRFGAHAESRVKAVWAGIQGDEWVREFLARPNAKVDEVDVLVTTSVLQAGQPRPESRRGQRRTRFDIESAWDVGAGAAWGQEYTLVKGVDEEWTKEQTAAYQSSMSTSISKYCLKYEDCTDDVTSIMDERANLGDVMQAKLASILSTVEDYAKHGTALLVKPLCEDGRQLPRTPAKEAKVMGEYIWLVATLDFDR
ncbi:hypothetical protein V1519DRAFT_462226 [Lipomyces tetrasporus]